MKKLFILCMLAGMYFISCTGEHQHDHSSGTHTHDDGSVHQDTLSAQEEFSVTDSSVVNQPDSQQVHPHQH